MPVRPAGPVGLQTPNQPLNGLSQPRPTIAGWAALGGGSTESSASRAGAAAGSCTRGVPCPSPTPPALSSVGTPHPLQEPSALGGGKHGTVSASCPRCQAWGGAEGVPVRGGTRHGTGKKGWAQGAQACCLGWAKERCWCGARGTRGEREQGRDLIGFGGGTSLEPTSQHCWLGVVWM